MKRLLISGMVVVLAVALAGCGAGGDGRFFNGPGLVGIDDTGVSTSPVLRVTYTVPPSTTLVTANIFSDLASDGDIAFDPFFNDFTVVSGLSEVLFGEDSSDVNLPEYRAFLTFPLDGITSQDVVPSDAVIVSATLEVFVDRVSFASVIPSFLDLVQYPFRGLSSGYFDTAPVSFRTLDFFSSDLGNYVLIDVTTLMEDAQLVPGLTDFQVRFIVDAAGTLSPTRAPSTESGRAVRSQPRLLDNLSPNRGSSASQPMTPPDQASRKR